MKIVADYARKLKNDDGDLEITFIVKGWNYKNFCNDLEKDTYTLEIKKVKSKRSVNQNKTFWKLVNEIDEKINGHKKNNIDLYVQLLEMAECKYEDIMIIERAIPMLKEQFRACKVMGKVSTTNGVMSRVRCFYGSSNFDTKEMYNLIQVTLDYASEVGLDTEFYRDILCR